MSRKSQRSQGSPSSQRNRHLTQQTIEKSFGDININDDEQANDLVRYIVNRAGEHMAFKQSEIKKHVLPKAGGQYFQDIVNKASKILKNVYGYNMMVVDATKNSAKEYIVSNALPYVQDPTETISEQEQEPPKDVNKILLLLILSHIFMSNNTVTEASLHSFLSSLQIDIERRHELFGCVKDYINHTLKKKNYLNIEMDQMSKKISYSWGPRAEKEVSKHEVLKFVCKMYNDRMPNSWVNQFKVAREQCYENEKEALPDQ